MGFIDTTGTMVIKPAYKSVYANLTIFSEGLAIVGLPNSYYYGFIDHSGKLFVADSFVAADGFSEGLAPVKRDSAGALTGFIDKTGKWVIPPKYSDAIRFHEGLAMVYFDDTLENTYESALIDHTGKYVYGPTQYQIWGPNEGIFLAEIDTASYEGKIQYFDATGKPFPLSSTRFESDIVDCLLFSEGLGGVAKYDSDSDLQFGFMNRQGDTIITPAYYRVALFSDGLSMVTIYENAEISFAYIDTTGTMVIPPIVDGMKIVSPSDFINGLAWIGFEAADHSQYLGYLNKSGKIIWKGPWG